MGAILGELRRVQGAPLAYRQAIRASGLLLTVLLVLWAVDRLDLGVYATFGVFATIYGGPRRWAGRWRLQAALGAVLTLAVATGAVAALGDARHWVAVLLAAVWAGVGAALSDRYRWLPPGPLFPVFAVATSSAIPTTTHTVLMAPLVTAVCATAGVALGALEVGLARRLGRPTEARPTLPPVPAAHRRRVQVVRCAVAVLVAGSLATAMQVGHPYWAMVAAVAPLSAFSVRHQLARGVNRAVGTIAGLGVAGLLLLAPLPTLAVLLVVAGLQGVTELIVVRHYGLAMLSITPLALIMVHLADPEPIGQLLFDRGVETLIGVGIGLAAAVLTRPRAARVS